MITAVGLFVVVPLAAGWLMRVLLKSPGRIERLEAQLKPLSITALIATVLLLFMMQAQAILSNPLAISLFGLNSGAALATVVGVLLEVPVMLSLVAIANRNQRLFPA